jgi:kinesin family member C1
LINQCEIALQTAKIVRDAEEKVRINEELSKSSIEELILARDAALQSAKDNADSVLGLKEEIQQLHIAMENTAVSSNRENIEELSRCKGEIEVLKQRLTDLISLNERQSSVEMKKIADFEEKLLVSETQRRKLHNLVQELRGNIRVFARVRPFLPGDGFSMNTLPDPSINVRPDLNSLKIARVNDANKREDFDFNFDKVFGQSCSQETLFSEVSLPSIIGF